MRLLFINSYIIPGKSSKDEMLLSYHLNIPLYSGDPLMGHELHFKSE